MPTESMETQNGNTKNEVGPMPKHIPFPEFFVGTNFELTNELIMFIFMFSSSVMQFINIYRSNYWWLQDSYTNHAVNFHLIEPYLCILIVLVTIRRLIYCLLLSGLEFLLKKKGCSNKEQMILRAFLRYTFATLFAVAFSYCVWKIYVRHSYFALFLLLYPIIVYFLIFGLKIEPFLRTQCEVSGAYLNGLPMHSCSSNPTAIRDEIEALRNDFNLRFRQIIFTSAINAYFAAFIPCFFAVSINYNKVWATQHIIFVWLTGLIPTYLMYNYFIHIIAERLNYCLTMACAFIFPSKYSDLLHRASLHLGYWYQIENNSLINSTATTVPYSESQFYVHSSIVKHNDEYYKSFGPLTVAIPGNLSHSRFYRLFQNPSLIFKVLSTLQGCIVLSEIFLLYFALEWHFILSISFIALTNQFTLFKICRDYFLTKRIYTAENSIGDRQNNALHTD